MASPPPLSPDGLTTALRGEWGGKKTGGGQIYFVPPKHRQRQWAEAVATKVPFSGSQPQILNNGILPGGSEADTRHSTQHTAQKDEHRSIGEQTYTEPKDLHPNSTTVWNATFRGADGGEAGGEKEEREGGDL